MVNMVTSVLFWNLMEMISFSILTIILSYLVFITLCYILSISSLLETFTMKRNWICQKSFFFLSSEMMTCFLNWVHIGEGLQLLIYICWSFPEYLKWSQFDHKEWSLWCVYSCIWFTMFFLRTFACIVIMVIIL